MARNPERLALLSRTLKDGGARDVTWAAHDFSNFDRHAAIGDAVFRELGAPDLILVGHAVFEKDRPSPLHYPTLETAMRVNFLSVASLLSPILERLIAERRTCRLVVLSSVAGDRGKARNFAYAISKAALTTYLQGLRNWLGPYGIEVLTVKPGLVRTPMTAHLPFSRLAVDAGRVARGIVRAVDLRRNEVYLPWFWWPIMAAVRGLPEIFFKRLKL